MQKILVVLFLFLSVSEVSLCAEKETSQIDVEKLVREIDATYRSNTSYAEVEMEIVTPHWQRTLAMDIWTGGMDKTFIRISSPKKEKGIATLRIDNEMWNFLPKINKVMKIPPSMMMGSWMGSDFTNDDLVKESTLFEDYRYRLITDANGLDSLIYIKCIPRKDLAVVWGSIVVAVRESDHMLVWQKYYDEKGDLMRVMNFKDEKQFGERLIPSVLELIPQNKKGQKTIIRYLKAEFDIKIDNQTFTLRNLRTQ